MRKKIRKFRVKHEQENKNTPTDKMTRSNI